MYEEDQEPPVHQDQDGAQPPQPKDEAPSQAELEEKARERDQFHALAQRAQADLINYRRRVEEERGALAQNASTRVIALLLPILDDFQRAMEHKPEDAPASWSDGVSMILRKLQAVVEGEGVTVFSPEPGTSFDPSEHESIYYEPSGEYPADCVVSTVRVGYRSATRVLRPAQVIVSQPSQVEENT